MIFPPRAPDPDSADRIEETALGLAKRWNLVCDNGEIVCMRQGCGLVATLPSLLCREHLASVRRGLR